MTRVLALDYGVARCGAAVSDPTLTVATPLDPIERPATRKGLRRVADVVATVGAVRVVVGLPLSLSGEDSAQTSEVREWVARLRAVLGDSVPVELYDERFTTKVAASAGGSASLDSRAAAVLLEDWIARHGSGG